MILVVIVAVTNMYWVLMLDPLLSSLNVLCHLFLMTTIWGKYCYYPHFRGLKKNGSFLWRSNLPKATQRVSGWARIQARLLCSKAPCCPTRLHGHWIHHQGSVTRFLCAHYTSCLSRCRLFLYSCVRIQFWNLVHKLVPGQDDLHNFLSN